MMEALFTVTFSLFTNMLFTAGMYIALLADVISSSLTPLRVHVYQACLYISLLCKLENEPVINAASFIR
jgi:hypothetical protein